MIALDGNELALVNAIVARVFQNQTVNFPNHDPVLKEIGEEIGADISVYDVGKIGSKFRFVRFDFALGSIEVRVKPRPEFIVPDLVPDDDGDGGTPGTPVITQLAQAA